MNTAKMRMTFTFRGIVVYLLVPDIPHTIAVYELAYVRIMEAASGAAVARWPSDTRSTDNPNTQDDLEMSPTATRSAPNHHPAVTVAVT